MKVEKKITRHGHDREAELEYYREAQVCPECGNSGLLKVVGIISIDFKSAMKYSCRECGCKWVVMPYHKKSKAEA